MAKLTLSVLLALSFALPGIATASGSSAAPPGPPARPTDRRLPESDPGAGDTPRKHFIVHEDVRQYVSFSLFLDPDPFVITKEFALFYNTVPDPARGPGRVRGLFHIIYQRSAGPQQGETMFGHAWSTDLKSWAVDTMAFTIDATAWNAAHVWSPSLVHHGSRDYLFYTGVDSLGDQRIGYASTGLLDTTDTYWDPARTMVWQASNTHWAVPRPWTYGYFTQFRDPYVMEDPEHAGQLLMFFGAHDSLDFALGRGGLVAGIARSEPGTVDRWADLGYYPSTLVRTTKVGQLEGPHVVPQPGNPGSWRLVFSNAGTPPGESGDTTIRFETLAAGASLADTTSGHWSAPAVLEQYLGGDQTVFGWSGSEYLHLPNADYLAGFTAWGPVFQGISIARMNWHGGEFTLGGSLVTAVDATGSDTKGVSLRVSGGLPSAREVRFAIDAPRALEARLEIFDAQGRRVRTLFAGQLAGGRTALTWDLSASDGGRVASGAYFARLAFAGGVRAARLAVVR